MNKRILIATIVPFLILAGGMIFLFTCTQDFVQPPLSSDGGDIDTTDWQSYQSEKKGLSFSYPDNWDLYEHENLGILLSETEIPRPLPPDILGLAVVIGVSEESEEEVEEQMRKADPSLTYDPVIVNGHQGKKYFSLDEAAYDEPKIFYRISIDVDKFLEIGVNSQTDPDIVQQILKTLEF